MPGVEAHPRPKAVSTKQTNGPGRARARLETRGCILSLRMAEKKTPRKTASLSTASILAAIGMCGSGGVAYAQTRAYVTDFGSPLGTQALLGLSVIDTSSNAVVATVGVGDSPVGVAITPDGTRAYVTNSRSSSVSVIDTSSNTVVATVGVGNSPAGVAITPDGTRAYVANSNASSVSVIENVQQHRRCHDKCSQQSQWGGHHSGRNSCLCGDRRLLRHQQWLHRGDRHVEQHCGRHRSRGVGSVRRGHHAGRNSYLCDE